MKYSLILATLDRPKEIEECLVSLEKQIDKDFEVIIIDQSENEETTQVVEKFDSINITYFHVKFKGLSKARNYGLKYAKGEYICLLDDDATYREDYLINASKHFLNNKIIVSGKILSNFDRCTSFVNYSKIHLKNELCIGDILNYCPSAALIFPIEVFNDGCYFNEKLGVGNDFASGEETDLLLEAYDLGYKVMHAEDMIVYHPIKTVNKTELRNLYRHYMGKGAMVKIDFIRRKKFRLWWLFLKCTFGMVIKAIFLDRANKEIYLMRMRGFLFGLCHFAIEGI